MYWTFLILSCIEPPPKIITEVEPSLELKRFQFENLEGILIDDKSRTNSRAVVYVGNWKETDIQCLHEKWNDYHRALIVFHAKDQQMGISYLRKQGYVTVKIGDYPCP